MNKNSKYRLVYKTSTTPFFPANVFVGFYSDNFYKLLGKKLKPIEWVAVIDDGVMSCFFHENLQKSAKFIYRKMIESWALLEKVQQKEKEISKKLLREIKTPVELLFDGGNLTARGEQKLKTLFELLSEYAEYVDAPAFLFQLYAIEQFKQDLSHLLGKQMSDDLYNLLLSSHKKTNYEKFQFELLKTIKENKVDRQTIAKISQKYFWLIHDYVGEIVDEKYVQMKLKELQKEPRQLLEQFNNTKERIKTIKKAKAELPSEVADKIEIIEDFLYLYNERKKEVANQINIYIRIVFEYKFKNNSVTQLRKKFQITPQEAIALLKGQTIIDWERRNKQWVYIMKNGKAIYGSLDYLSLVANENKSKILKGTPASKGTIKGKVTLVLNASHMSNFKKGSILVAPFTNVNYLPVMHQAKAILTETGGLTSHAAIVSRELGKPSIVGIKNLIASLKDDDLVEVDADKGIVKIIK